MTKSILNREYVTKVNVLERDWKGLLAGSSKVSPGSVSGLLWLLLAYGSCSLTVLGSDVPPMAAREPLLSMFFCNN